MKDITVLPPYSVSSQSAQTLVSYPDHVYQYVSTGYAINRVIQFIPKESIILTQAPR